MTRANTATDATTRVATPMTIRMPRLLLLLLGAGVEAERRGSKEMGSVLVNEWVNADRLTAQSEDIRQ